MHDNDDDIDEDEALWRYVTKSVTPIDRADSFRAAMKSMPRNQDEQSKEGMKADMKAALENTAISGKVPAGGKSSTSSQKETGNILSRYKELLSGRRSLGDVQQDYAAQEQASDEASLPGLDKRTEERLRRGQIAIEARIDLHGYNKEQAKGVLNEFIKGAYNSGKRCVLVITGKGSAASNQEHFLQNKGVLKKSVPGWLAEPPLSAMVLRSYPAKPKDGGAGALYVYLRRARNS